MEKEEATLSPHFRDILWTFSYAIHFDNIDKVTPALSDIFWTAEWFINHKKHKVFVSSPFHIAAPKPPLPRGMQLKQGDEHKRMLWFILEKNYRVGNSFIGVDIVVTYKQVLQEGWGPKLEDIGRELVEWGIPFMLIWPYQSLSCRTPAILSLSTTLQAANYVYSIDDYYA